MSCINELLSKNCVPVEFEEFLLKLFQQTFQLLQRITKDTGPQAVENLLTEQDERWAKEISIGRRSGLMVSVLDSGSSGPGSSPGQGHCVVFLGKTLYSHSASPHSGV